MSIETCFSVIAIALVGQALAHAPMCLHLFVSTAGIHNPFFPNSEFEYFKHVLSPPLQIVPRVREIHTFVDQWKIRYDITIPSDSSDRDG
jgi:hypothetical protein